MIDYLSVVAAESRKFARAIRSSELQAKVPSCPEWNAADLAWHLTEVQHFWAAIVEGLLQSPDQVEELVRPADDELPGLFDMQSARLVTVLGAASPGDECWSWNSEGHSVGWVRRRQAHEALIHRADAELAVGIDPVLDAEIAADGVDELFRNWYGASVPPWVTITPDGTTMRIELTDSDATWDASFGRFTGTSPDTGNEYDMDDLAVMDEPVAEPSVVLRGAASAMNLWLWGRGPADTLDVTGDDSLVARIRQIVAASTQ